MKTVIPCRIAWTVVTFGAVVSACASDWVYGCEDLYMERDSNRIWTAAEHPDARDTVSINRLEP